MTRTRESGFTLLEALVALALVAMVVLSYLGLRTRALMDASEARNWRLSRELAEEKLSELRAGARDLPPESGAILDFEDYPGFSFQILIGEAAVADADAEAAGDYDQGDYEENDRYLWQQDRDLQRRAQQKGMSYYDYEDHLRQEEDARLREESPPSETEFEEVAVVVYFPKVRLDEEQGQDAFILKDRISTLAISGLTPDQAETQAAAMGQSATGGGNTPPGLFGDGGSGGNTGGVPR